MKATVESTQVFLKLHGVTVRMWKGVNEHGMAFTMFVHCVVPDDPDRARVFEAELLPLPDPAQASADVGAVLPLEGPAASPDAS